MRGGARSSGAFVMFAAVLLVACGGGSNSADKPYVDAMTASAMASKDRPSGVTEGDARCLAQAVVGFYHAKAFETAKLTPAKLREPDSDLHALPTPTRQQARKIGGAAQKCRAGKVFATAIGSEFKADAAGNKCFAGKLDRDFKAAEFLGVAVVDNAKITSAEARPVVDLLVECYDLGTVVTKAGGLQLTDAEQTCVNKELEASNEFRDLMARSIAGGNTSDAQGQKAVLPAMLKCVTPERMRQLGG